MMFNSTQTGRRFRRRLAFHLTAIVAGALLVLSTGELSADRRGSGGSVRQSRTGGNGGANRNNNYNRNVNNVNVNRNVNNVNVNRNVNVKRNVNVNTGYGYPRRGAVAVGEEGAVAVGRRGAVAV